MAIKYPVELVGVLDGAVPRLRADGAFVGGALTRFRATIVLAAAGNGLVTTADAVRLPDLPAGYAFAFGIIIATATMGASATLAIGTSETHASNGQYRAAATFTTANVPTLFGLTAAMGAAPAANAVKQYLTVGVADLPTAGTLLIDIYASAPR